MDFRNRNIVNGLQYLYSCFESPGFDLLDFSLINIRLSGYGIGTDSIKCACFIIDIKA